MTGDQIPSKRPRGLRLREWQTRALEKWRDLGRKGIVSVVTGGGKTVFALACIEESQADTALVVVPTLALLDQWWAESASFLGLALDDIHIVKGNGRMRKGTLNITVLNTAARLVDEERVVPSLLVVDECHKAASPTFRKALNAPKLGSLGLSATPERPYDDGLAAILEPSLGPLFYSYTYADALKDKVIVPFKLHNVVFDLEADRREEYEKISRKIARAIAVEGVDSDRAIALMLQRARIVNLSPERVRVSLRIVAAHRHSKIIIFHEDIDACEIIQEVLLAHNIQCGIYHSKMPIRARAEALRGYRAGDTRVLITCRALDEGFNVPEAEIAIIAASTATRRQRIQRLGRVLRPSKDKEFAAIYSLAATGPEIQRLRTEERELEGVARVSWSKA